MTVGMNLLKMKRRMDSLFPMVTSRRTRERGVTVKEVLLVQRWIK